MTGRPLGARIFHLPRSRLGFGTELAQVICGFSLAQGIPDQCGILGDSFCQVAVNGRTANVLEQWGYNCRKFRTISFIPESPCQRCH